MSESLQQEELEKLRSRGWTIHFYATGQWNMPCSEPVLEVILALATGRLLDHEDTHKVVYNGSGFDSHFSRLQIKKGTTRIELTPSGCDDSLWD
jgi:hypothetical protein